MDNYIFIGAFARSGSTLLCELLKNFEELHVLYEIFHFRLQTIKNAVPEFYPELRRRFDLPDDPEAARAALVADPGHLLDVLQTGYPGKILAFKVFPGHLAPEALPPLLDRARLTLLLTRNLVHAYLSTQIARATQQFALHDTSGHYVAFDPAEFRRYAIWVQKHLLRLRDHARQNGLPLAALDYETLVKADDPTGLVADALAAGFPVPLTRRDVPLRTTRQDKRARASEKVSNPEEMLQFLSDNGLEALDDALQENPPLTRPLFAN